MAVFVLSLQRGNPDPVLLLLHRRGVTGAGRANNEDVP